MSNGICHACTLRLTQHTLFTQQLNECSRTLNIKPSNIAVPDETSFLHAKLPSFRLSLKQHYVPRLLKIK
jgi:hypothetical protein